MNDRQVSRGLREWSNVADTLAMQALASRCWPRGLHPGGLGWSWATEQLAERTVLFDDADGVLHGWAGITQPGSLVLQVAPGRPDVRTGLVEWLIRTADGPQLTVDAFDQDVIAALTAVGFKPEPPPFGYYRMGQSGLRAGVEDLTAVPPIGYTIRSVRDDEDVDRVAIHRLAWRPADLPFDSRHRPDLDESWTSSFTAEIYRRVQAAGLYDGSLDLVVVAPDGSLAGCCIGWLDPATGWVEIEPLGVAPVHRRRGLALAMCAEVARRASLSGGTDVFINTGPSEMYPAPYQAYRKAGFAPYVHGTMLIRR